MQPKYTIMRFWFEGCTECETFYTTKYITKIENLNRAVRRWEKMQGKKIVFIEDICTAKTYDEAIEKLSVL